VSESGIQFRHYYFPIGSKSVPFADIMSIESKPNTLLNGKWRLWGTGDFMTWFPRDWKRPQRSSIFFLRLAGQKIRIGFTVENAEQFIRVIESKGVKVSIHEHG
jgi:hypothetical protein